MGLGVWPAASSASSYQSRYMFSAPGDHQPNGTIVEGGSRSGMKRWSSLGRPAACIRRGARLPQWPSENGRLAVGAPTPGRSFWLSNAKRPWAVLQRDMSLERLAGLQPAFAAGARLPQGVRASHCFFLGPHPGRGFWLSNANRLWAGLQRDMSLERLGRPAACIRRGSRLLQGVSASRCFVGGPPRGEVFGLC